ncbi:MAG: alkaline phosphatase family protein [Acidobacteria bacterium]|nr:alkaline phosphatase family protein [Acidobacteriota bacterium]
MDRPVSADGAPRKVVILGFDGLDPEAVRRWCEAGKLPHFSQLAEGGAFGRLRSREPLLSPIIWTTIATGRLPVDHGITNFVTRSTTDGEELPVTSRQRRTRALWNLFTDAGRSVAVVGWWASWPAEAVDGAMVSDRAGLHFLLQDELAGEDLPAVVYPPELEADVDAMLRRPEDVGLDELAAYADVPPGALDHPFDFKDQIDHLRWAIATTDAYRAIGEDLERRLDPDLLMVYFEATDSVAHLFGHLVGRHDLAGELAEQQKHYGHVVEAMYRRADAILGEYLERLPDDAVLLVMSDHGFELGELPEDPSKTRDLRRVSAEFHRIDGVFYAYGAGVRPGFEIEGASILDVTPTVLALAGLPASQEMPGRVLAEAFEGLAVPDRVSTYETGERSAGPTAESGAMDQALLEKLRSLGYLGGGGEEAEHVDRNQAALLLEAGRYREAAKAYHQLLEVDPDRADLNTDFAVAMIALGRNEEARAAVDRALEAEPDYAPAYYRRGILEEAAGDLEAAIADYRRAVRFDDKLKGPVKALERLGVPLVAAVASTPETVRSAQLLDQAREAAQRGDYDEAWSLLEEAESLTPEAPVVYQYKSNVAFLRGDRQGAIEALEKALELAPDDARLRANLRRLKEKG